MGGQGMGREERGKGKRRKIRTPFRIGLVTGLRSGTHVRRTLLSYAGVLHTQYTRSEDPIDIEE